jgi:hypothetical protein
MKRLILAIAVVAISTAVQAQDKESAKSTTVSIAGNVGIPTTTGLSFAVGGDIQGDFAVAEGLKLTLSVGYENYSRKSSLGGGSTYIIPVLGGVKFPFSDKLYGHAQLGYGFGKGGGGAFAYAPSIGYNLSENFDISLKYLGFSSSGNSSGSINLRLAYDL